MLSFDTPIGLLAPITWGIPPKRYGPWSKVVAELGRGLVEAGYHNVTIYSTADVAIEGVQTIFLVDKPLGEFPQPGREALELLHIAHVFKHAANHQAILHNHLNYHPLLFSEFVSVPILTTLHGSGIEESAQVAYRHYRHLPYVSISEAERQFIPELNYLRTVYNGLDFAKIPFNPTPQPYLAYTGRIHPSKGVHHAIRLARQLEIPLHIAGFIQEEWRQYYEETVAQAVDNNLIFFHGNLTALEVQNLVAKATAYVGLIEWDEPFGLAIAEAMASGTPAIATPRGAHREIVHDGVSGILVSRVEEAVERFPEISSLDRARCRATAQAIFDLPNMIEGYLAAYAQLVVSY